MLNPFRLFRRTDPPWLATLRAAAAWAPPAGVEVSFLVYTEDGHGRVHARLWACCAGVWTWPLLPGREALVLTRAAENVLAERDRLHEVGSAALCAARREFEAAVNPREN